MYLRVVDMKELLLTWSHLTKPLWKKALAFSKLTAKMGLSAEEVSQCIYEIVEESSTGTICRLSSSAAAFLLLCLDGAGSSEVSESSDACLLRLIPCVEFPLARQLSLPALVFDMPLKWTETSTIPLLHFFPSIKVDWMGLSKYLSELKGLSQEFQDFLPFLGNFFARNISNPELYGIVDRLARRNSALASAMFHQIVQCDAFSECIEAYSPVFEALVPVDNETVRAYMCKVSKIAVLNDQIYSSLLKLFPSASPKGKENIAKFTAEALMTNKPEMASSTTSNVVLELATKELSGSDVTLSSLIQCAAILNSESLSSDFLKVNLKNSQKISIKSAIVLGIAKSGNFSALTVETLKEIISPNFLKEAAIAGTPQSQGFFICSLGALVSHPEFSPDSKLLNDSLQALAKPAGPAVLVEKGWSSLDPSMAEIFLSQVVLPVVFENAMNCLLPYAISALAWFSINGTRENFNLIRKHAKCLGVDKADMLAASLEKHLDHHSSDAKAHRVWSLLHMACSLETFKSRPLALLCHDKSKLLGLGAGSWAELVRSACPPEQTDTFCLEQVKEFIKMGDLLAVDKCAFYLLETLISLSPSLVSEELCPVESVSSALDELLKFTPAQWSLLSSSTVKKTTGPVKSSSKPQAQTLKAAPLTPKSGGSNDDLTIKDSLAAAISKFKNSIMTIRAIALALPFHSLFAQIRPVVLVSLIENLFKLVDPALVGFVVESVYEIAAESLDGQGPLLVSLYLRSCGQESLINASWLISDEVSLIDSVFKIVSSHANVSELSLCALTLQKALPLARSLFDTLEFKNILSHLQKLAEQAEEVDSRVILDFVLALLEISPSCPVSIQASIVLLLVELGEIPRLEIFNEFDLFSLNSCLRSSMPASQLMVLKFLTAYAASHSSSGHSLVECSELMKTVWLLHFSIETEKDEEESAAEDVGDGIENVFSAESSKTYEINEITAIASELCEIIQFKGKNFDYLPELVLLETEKGEKEFQAKNLVEHYIAAIGDSIRTESDLEKISEEFKQLFASKTTPNGIVRLTKNVDRTKLDFTKQTRKALLRSVSVASSKQSTSLLLSKLISFCFDTGFADSDESNCEITFSAALKIVQECCDDAAAERLYAQLQQCLTSVQADNDRIKVYAVILLGRASSRVPSLTGSPARVWELIDRIKESLNIPSERVQKAVADTLVPLFRAQRDDKRISTLTFGFTARLRDAKEDYGALRGAAFGLAALIEACGTLLIRSHEIFTMLLDGLTRLNQKNSESAVCSALAAIEIISIRCGISFEPYIAPLVPGVLEALGDSRARVREDAEACADAMMSALSPLSVALILPPLLDMAGMDSCDPRYSWRAKLGAVTWLGSMACLAPKVLTPALPRIIPALIVALTDAHEKVHLAAHHALAVKYAAIIRSPEIKAALPAILRALSDPPRYASACLGDIIGTSFCHAVDGPSLALLEPLLSRALRERGTGAMSEAKRRAILIIANLGSLMDPAELRPYLVNLIPALRNVLGDAVPQVRSGSARALGVLMRLMHNNGLSQDCPVLQSLVPECLETIFSTLPSVSAIDRAGAAMAMAQVTASRGLEPLVQLVNEHVAPVLFNEKSTSPGSSREALLHLCAALPAALSPAQIPKLYESVFTRDRLFSILQGTASEDEGVREISTKTIRSLLLRQALFVDLQAALEILLKGCSDGRWRVRLTSFTILTDLLPVLSMAPETSICDTQNRTVSGEMRARVLSRLFFGRFDSSGLIRNVAFCLWKSIVAHPPRVILEILPNLVDDCVASLELPDGDDSDFEDDESDYESDSEFDDADSEEDYEPASANVKVDRYEMAAGALQDILVKLSDRVLLPLLRRLTQIFTSPSCADGPGVLLAARIVTSVILVPNLVPPHQRSASSAPVVSVPRALIDEALKIVLNLTQLGLTSEFEKTVNVSVGLFAKIASGLVASPALLDRIISDVFFEQNNTEALISVLNRRPRILLPSLVNRFKKLTSLAADDWEWWSDALSAPGPFLAPFAPALITHALKLLGGDSEFEAHAPLFDALIASMAAYDPEIMYGDEEDGAESDSDDLEDSVESGLFSFGQLLETLWSARNQPTLAASMIEHFCQHGCNGIDRFYDLWIDRLFVATFTDSAFPPALEGLIERAIEREETEAVISQLLQSIETRSIVSKSISSKVPGPLLIVLIKSLCLPVISDASLSTSERFEACKLLSCLLISGDNLKSLPVPAATALLGALIRCLSDRSESAAAASKTTERIKAALLPILLAVLRDLPAVGKPFHPQLARLGVNVLKDLIGSVSVSGNSIDFDQNHARGQIALVTGKIVALLLSQMSRVDVLLDELGHFRIQDPEAADLYDDLSTRNARKILLSIIKNCSSSPATLPPNLASFTRDTIKFFMTLPSSEIELIRETAQVGLAMADNLPSPASTELKTFINNLI